MDEQLRIDENDVRDLILWHAEARDQLPSNINRILSHYERLSGLLIEERNSSKRRINELVLQLLIAFGLRPSSEKTPKIKPDVPLSPDLLLQILRSQKDRHANLGNWHRDLKNKHNGKVKIIEGKIMNLEDIILSEEEIAQNRREQKEHIERASLGDGNDPGLALPSEMILHKGLVELEHDYQDASVDRTLLPKGSKVESVFFEDRSRFDFALQLTNITISVEKLKVESADGSQIISASTREFGPPKMQVTWNFLSNMVILVSRYGIPLNRFAGLVSSDEKTFHSGEISRYFQYVARRLLPVYIESIYELAQADVLQGDDTPSLVLEVRKGLSMPDQQKPWAGYATKEKSAATNKTIHEDPSLSLATSEVLGFEFERSGNQKGSKTGFNTSILAGKSNQNDPRSLIVIFRSHLGGLNNLLNSVLSLRSSERKSIVIQSDLSRVNLVNDPEVLRNIEVKYAGCTSHARRDFKLHEHEDPVHCARIINLFNMIFYFEKSLELYNRNEQSVRAVREVDSLAIWNEIHEVAEIIAGKWSKETKLGEAARYVTRHFEKLTYYLGDPRIDVSNNFSERMLRMENIIESQSLFRSTVEGRVALDIIRSVLQTATAADISLQDYLLHVLQATEDDVADSPQKYTPLAYRDIMMN